MTLKTFFPPRKHAIHKSSHGSPKQNISADTLKLLIDTIAKEVKKAK